MYLLGTILIVSGIVAALVASVSYMLVTRGHTAALNYGRFGTRAALGAVLLVVALLLYLFVMRRYDIKYVYDYSSAELEFRFRVASLWAGQPGSFVIWALWGLIAAQFLIRRTRHAEPYVLSVFMLLQAALLFFMLIINPFTPYTDPTTGAAIAPPDGKGLNELLHNPWMVIHRSCSSATPCSPYRSPSRWAVCGGATTTAGCSAHCPGRWRAGPSWAPRCCWAATGPTRRSAGAATGAGTRSRTPRWCPG